MTAPELAVATRGRHKLMDVTALDFHPRNVRVDLGDLRDLTASIAEVGVLEPLLAEERGQRARVLAGHRRLAASRLAGLRRVPCVLVDECDDADAIATMVSENHHRLGLTPTEKTAAARTLRGEFGWSQTRIAQRFGVHPQTVGRWLGGGAADDQPPPRAAGGPATTPRRPPAAPKPPPPPRVPGLDIHDVLQRWQDSAPPALLAELRGLLNGWTP